jgi:AcrR family transcriptional regulator
VTVTAIEVGARLTKAGRTRARILDAAAAVFREKGYGGAGVRDIAAAANIQAGSLYYHFPSRDALVTEVLRVGQQRISDAVDERLAALPSDAVDLDRVRAMMSAHVEALVAHGDYTSAALRLLYTVPPEIQERQLTDARAYGDLWRELLTAAQRSGDVRRDVDPSAMRMFIIGAVNSTPDWYQPDGGGLSPTELATEFGFVFLDGIATHHRRRRRATVRVINFDAGASDAMARPPRAAATRTRILESAAHAFRQKGFAETALNDVAEAVGMQRESLYYHFTSLEEVAAQLLRDAWEHTTGLVQRSVEALPADATGLDRLATAMSAHLLSMLGEGGYTAGLVHVLAQAPQDVRQQSLTYKNAYLHFWRRLAKEAQDAGELRSDIDLPTTVLILISSLSWAVEWYQSDGRLPPGLLADQFLSMVLDGLGTREDPQR